VPGALVAVARYGQARQWKLAEAALQDDLSAGSFSGGTTAQGHQGYWVAQQVSHRSPAMFHCMCSIKTWLSRPANIDEAGVCKFEC